MHFKDMLQKNISSNKKPFAIWDLFDPNPKVREELDVVVDGIFLKCQQQLGDFDRLIAIERSGIPIAALIAYFYRKDFSILRTIPKLVVRPEPIQGEKVALIDDISYTGWTFLRAKKLMDEKKVKSKAFSIFNERDIHKDIKLESLFGSGYESYRKIKNMDKKGRIHGLAEKIDLKETILAKCVLKDKEFWVTWELFSSDIFPQICMEFLQKTKEIEGKFGIIANSVYGLPFASVLSYELKKPLYLFSRLPHKLEIDFEPKLRPMNDFILVDDVVDTGTMIIDCNKLLQEKGKNILKCFAILNLNSKGKNTSNIDSIVTEEDIWLEKQ